MTESIIRYLRNVGKDCAEEDELLDTSPECDGDCCPSHEDCGLCRFEYMKKQGWLSEEVKK